MDLSLVEIARRLENLIRPGTIIAADYPNARVKVKTGGITTKWVPWLTSRAGNDRDWFPPSIGEQVILFSPSGDPAQGFALSAIYQQAHPAPSDDPDAHRIEYSNGAVIQYHQGTNQLIATLPTGGTVDVVADGGITLTGDVTINGKMHATEQVSTDAGVTAAQDVTANGVSLEHHLTTNVEPGAGISGEPVK